MGQICPMACFCMASKLRMAFTFLKCHLNKEEEEEYTIKNCIQPTKSRMFDPLQRKFTHSDLEHSLGQFKVVRQGMV